MDDTDDLWLRVDAAADELGVKPGTLRSWLRRGRGPAHYRMEGMIVMRRSDVLAFREARRVAA